MSDWSLTVEREGRKPITKSGQLDEDKFRILVTNPTGVQARVGVNVGESMEYGALKVGATVTLTCDQNEPMINKAGELAFYKAVEIMKDGYKELTG